MRYMVDMSSDIGSTLIRFSGCSSKKKRKISYKLAWCWRKSSRLSTSDMITNKERKEQMLENKMTIYSRRIYLKSLIENLR